jgi:hypothetical protein
MSETQQVQKSQQNEVKPYILTEDEIKELDKESVEFLQQEYVEGGQTFWIKHPKYDNAIVTNQATILDKAMDFFKFMADKQQKEGYSHVVIGDKKFKIGGEYIWRSKFYKDGEKKPWKSSYVKKDKFLEEIFVTTDFEMVNSKVGSNKDHNWEVVNTMLNPTDNTLHFIIGRYKPQTTSSSS